MNSDEKTITRHPHRRRQQIRVALLISAFAFLLFRPWFGLAQAPVSALQLEDVDSQRRIIDPVSRFPIKFPVIPEPVRPQRHEPKPLDLSDKQACLRELAELCTYPMTLNRYEGAKMRGPFFAYQPFCGYFNALVLDAVVRFDRLEKAPDSEVRSLASRARKVMNDIWALDRAYSNYGALWKTRQASDATWTSTANTASAGLKASGEEVQAQAIESQRNFEYALQGRTITEAPAAPDYSSFWSSYSSALGAWERENKLNAEIGAYLDVLYLAVATRFEELNAIWSKELLPRLKSYKTYNPAQGLLGPNYTQALRTPGLTLVRYEEMISLRNICGNTLSNLIVEIKHQGFLGDVSSWYGFLPRLGTNEKIYVLSFDQSSWLIKRAATSWKVNATIWSDAGRQEISEMMTFGIGNDFLVSQKSGFNKSAIPWSKTTEVSPLVKKIRDEKAADRAQLAPSAASFLEKTRKKLNIPPNPVIARSNLMAALKLGTDYQVIPPEFVEWESQVIRLGAWDSASGTVDVTLTARWKPEAQTNLFGKAVANAPAPRVAVAKLAGRFNEDLENGFALGIASEEDSANFKKDFAGDYIQLVTARDDLLNCKKERMVKRHVLDTRVPGEYTMVGQYTLTEERMRQHELLCSYTIFLNGSGELSLQSFSEPEILCRYFRLKPAVK